MKKQPVTLAKKKAAPAFGVKGKVGVKFSSQQKQAGDESSEVNGETEATSNVKKYPEIDDSSSQQSHGFNTKVERTMREIDALKEDLNYNLHAKAIDNSVEVKLYEDKALYDPKFDPKNMSKKDKFVLKPNPIMRLDRVVGWHPHNTCG